jgi:general L-amino acid transport system permease protein
MKGSLAAPRVSSDPITWSRENLFSTPFNTALTIVAAVAVWAILYPLMDWAIVRGVFSGDTREACLGENAGACWPYIRERFSTLIYGLYDPSEQWRADLVFLIGAGGLAWLTIPLTPYKWTAALLMVTAFPAFAAIVLPGGAFGLAEVPTERWGGLMLSLIIAATGIVLSFPFGILLALGRQSDLPVIKWFSIVFIEFWRGVPLITVLFMAQNMLPLFLPDGISVDKLLRALVAFTIFSSAYMAEVVRGGLQAIPRGQYEAAQAMGLGYWTMMSLIILPQALRVSIPNIVNICIGLLKDTSLVSIIGFFDLLGMIQLGNQDPEWATASTAFTGYAFAAAIYWALCFSMSRYSRYWERRLATGEAGIRTSG